MTDLTHEPAPMTAEDASPQDIPAASLALVLGKHGPDFDGDGDAGWINCNCGATFLTGLPGDLADWWEHFKAQMLGLCIVCGSSDPDGPTDSNNDKWCNACNDAAVSG